MAQPKLKKGDTVIMEHETEMGGCLLECTVLNVKGKKIFLQVQIPFEPAFVFEVHENELQLSDYE